MSEIPTSPEEIAAQIQFWRVFIDKVKGSVTEKLGAPNLERIDVTLAELGCHEGELGNYIASAADEAHETPGASSKGFNVDLINLKSLAHMTPVAFFQHMKDRESSL